MLKVFLAWSNVFMPRCVPERDGQPGFSRVIFHRGPELRSVAAHYPTPHMTLLELSSTATSTATARTSWFGSQAMNPKPSKSQASSFFANRSLDEPRPEIHLPAIKEDVSIFNPVNIQQPVNLSLLFSPLFFQVSRPQSLQTSANKFCYQYHRQL